jgi:MFS family permease
VWGIGVLCYGAAQFHRLSLGVAAPEALVRFDSGPGVLAVFSALQLGVYAAMQIPSGLFADRWGPRRMLTAGALALALGSAILSVSTALAGGIVARVLIGLGDAVMFTNVLQLVAHWFPRQRYGFIVGLTGLVGGIGQLVATVPLTAILHRFGWTAAFGGAAVLTLVIALVAVLVVRDRPVPPSDVANPAIVAEQLVTEEAAATRPEPVWTALRSAIAQPGTRYAFLIHFVLMGQFVALTALWGDPWLTKAQGQSAGTASTVLMACVVAYTVSIFGSGHLATRTPRTKQRVVEVAVLAVLLAWVALICSPGRLPLAAIIVLFVIMGAGSGISMLAFDAVRIANPSHRLGTASGVVNVGGFASAAIAQVGVGLVLQSTAGLPAITAYRLAFLPIVLLVIVGGLALRRHRHPGRVG